MGNLHRQFTETVAALAGSGTVVGTTRDMQGERASGFRISLTITRDSVDTDVDVIVEHSLDSSLWREVELTNLAVTGGAPTNELDKEYVPTRRFMRVRIVNKTANGLSVTELLVLRMKD